MKKVEGILSTLFMAGLSVVLARPALAAVTADEAKALGATLTEFGAEKAGNQDGSIPPYTGGIESAPGYDPEKSRTYVDPYASDKPLYTISASNMEQYAALLTDGVKGLFKRNPDFRMDVYPSHRSVRYPAWILANSLKNATTAKLAGEVEGDSMTGADKEHDSLPFPGIPFPIPKNGYEVMWNHQLRYGAPVEHGRRVSRIVDAAGNASYLPGIDEEILYPWYDQTGELRKRCFNAPFGFSVQLTDPPSSAGTVFLNYYLVGGQKVWFYSPGQRRVRLAPEFAYDVPIASYGGVLLWDELFGFVGRMDRFDFKLTGKKEMIIPYNSYAITNTMLSKDVTGPKFINPAAQRWEKHRVWVVEATRKPNARHAYGRRTFYVDEDCWCVVLAEGYDNAGALYRVHVINSYSPYNVGGINVDSWTTYDVIKGNYFVVNIGHGDPGKWVHHYPSPKGLTLDLTPQEVAAAGVR